MALGGGAQPVPGPSPTFLCLGDPTCQFLEQGSGRCQSLEPAADLSQFVLALVQPCLGLLGVLDAYVQNLDRLVRPPHGVPGQLAYLTHPFVAEYSFEYLVPLRRASVEELGELALGQEDRPAEAVEVEPEQVLDPLVDITFKSDLLVRLRIGCVLG